MGIIVGGTYRPVPPDQINDRDEYGHVGCTAYAVAAVDERNVLGLDPVYGWDLTAYLQPTARGLTLDEGLAGLLHVAGRTLERRTVNSQGLWYLVNEGRAVVVQGDSDRMDPCGHGFRGNHSVAVNDARLAAGHREYLVGDPLCNRWIWLPASMLVAYAEKLWGERFPVAASRPVRLPSVSVKGTFWRYAIADGVITGRSSHTSGGFSALTSVPRAVRWPAKNTTRLLVSVVSGAFQGWWIEPLATNVRYAGEVT